MPCMATSSSLSVICLAEGVLGAARRGERSSTASSPADVVSPPDGFERGVEVANGCLLEEAAITQCVSEARNDCACSN